MNLKIRWGNGRPEGFACGSSLQWCEGEMVPFSIGSYIIGPDMIQSACFWDVWGGGGVESLSLLLTTTLSCAISYMMTRRASLRRSPRLCHLRCCNMSPTLDVFRCLLVKYLAVLRWTMVLLMSHLRWWSHTEQAYSSDGLTNDLYACSLTEVEPMFRLRRKNPRILLSLPQMLLMWLSHLRSSLMVTLRYFDLSRP